MEKQWDDAPPAFPFNCDKASEVAQNRIDNLKRAKARGVDIMSPDTDGYLGRHEAVILAAHCGLIHAPETWFKLNARTRLSVSVNVNDLGGQSGDMFESLYDVPSFDAAKAVQKRKTNP